MTALLRAELIKHLGLRLTWVMLAVVTVVAGGISTAVPMVAGSHGSEPLGRPRRRSPRRRASVKIH